MVASECEPYAKTGGLADVVDALARALGERGCRIDVYLPLYRGLEPPAGPLQRRTFAVPIGSPPGARRDAGDVAEVDLVSAQADGYRLRLVDHPFSFDRSGLYGEAGTDYDDNAARFAILGRTALEAIRIEAVEAGPEEETVAVLHGHDWQAGPALLLLRHRYASDPALQPLATLLTCHNLAYHGWTPRDRAWELDLPSEVGEPRGVDLLREALREVELANTVSPTYARESRGHEHGAGLDDLLRARADRYLGILNGIDPGLWDPATDAALAAPFRAEAPGGKVACKQDLLRRHGLSRGDDGPWGGRGAPLLGMVGRLDPQKGFDLLTGAAEQLLDLDARLVVLGTGDHALIAGLQALAGRHPDRLAVLERFDRDEARRIYAGADGFLMPSRFEPCGQGQMIALRYGTVPIVRATGGLADTIADADADAVAGNGFVFGPAEPAALAGAVGRAVAAYRDRERWSELVRRAMASDFSWAPRAAEYTAAYRRALEIRGQAT